MAKKTRRVVRPAAGQEKIPAPTPKIEAPVPAARPATAPRPRPGAVAPARPAMTRQEVTAEEFKAEYAYVLKDLRRVFVLAAVMFTLLILLNLILR